MEQANIKIELLRMLDWLIQICEDRNIMYFLAGGSLLGAIRHQGFIPWDDDVDILLPRHEYDRLLDVLRKICSSNANFALKDMKSDEQYSLAYAKIESLNLMVREFYRNDYSGVWIDIFPLDGLPDKLVQRKWHLLFARILKYCCWESDCLNHIYAQKSKKIVKIILFAPMILVGSRRWAILLDRHARKFGIEGRKKVACVVGKYMERECVDATVFLKGKDASFEGRTVKVPVGYHQYLSSIYGDYMRCPDKEHRSNHVEKNTPD